MEYAEETLPKEHVTFGNVAVIFLCAAVLVLVTFMKSGFKISFHSEAKAVQKYTYEQAQREALAELGQPASNLADSSQDESQLALLDPSSEQGQVAGASTGTEEDVLPNVEGILSDEVLGGIKLQLVSETNSETVAQYKEDFSLTELQNNADVLMLQLSSENVDELKQLPDKFEVLIKEMLQVPVPAELAKYHKVQLVYYAQLEALAAGYAKIQGAPDVQDTGMLMLSLTQLLDKMRSEIQAKYGVQL